jgi:hypothetical protein
MALPSHLLEAKKRMESASKQEPEEVKAETQAPAEQQQPPVQEVVQEQPQSDEVFALDVSDDEPATTEQPQQQPVQQNAEIEALKKEVDQYKARWETLQGKYRKSEEAREKLAQERSVVDNELNGLRAKVADLEKQNRQLTKKKLSERIQESLSEEERVIHGETIPVFSRMADQIQSSHEEEMETLRQELATQKQAQVEAATQSQIRSFHEAFRARVPDAEAVAKDSSWQAFTAKRDAISGKQISEIWEEQVRSMNVNGLVKIIEAWRKTNNASKAPAAPKTPTLSAAAPQPKFTETSRFKYSEFKRASDARLQNIQDQEAKKSYEAVKKRFEEAKARNLVDYAA